MYFEQSGFLIAGFSSPNRLTARDMLFLGRHATVNKENSGDCLKFCI